MCATYLCDHLAAHHGARSALMLLHRQYKSARYSYSSCLSLGVQEGSLCAIAKCDCRLSCTPWSSGTVEMCGHPVMWSLTVSLATSRHSNVPVIVLCLLLAGL
jgi:hypothetical protein